MCRKLEGILISTEAGLVPGLLRFRLLCSPPHHHARGNGTASPQPSWRLCPETGNRRQLGWEGVPCQIYKWLSANQSYRTILEHFQLKWVFKTRNCHQVSEVGFMGSQCSAQLVEWTGNGGSGWGLPSGCIASDHKCWKPSTPKGCSPRHFLGQKPVFSRRHFDSQSNF